MSTDSPSPEAPKKKSKKGLIIGIVAAIAVLAVIVEVASSGGGDDATETTSAASAPAAASAAPAEEAPAEEAPAEEAPAEEAGLGIGDPAADGKFTFTVKKVKCGVKKVGSEFLNEKAQGQFCLVTMNVQNTGDEAQIFDAGSQKGITNTGAEVEADGTASTYANEDGVSFLEEINPGNGLENVVVVYDIAKDQTLDAVVLFDSMFSGGVTVSLK